MTAQHWILIADSMDYDDCDAILGAFGTLDAAIHGHLNYVVEAATKYPSATSVRSWNYSICLWMGRVEVERWEKRGSRDWRKVEVDK